LSEGKKWNQQQKKKATRFHLIVDCGW
jgi:hypothetical protein